MNYEITLTEGEFGDFNMFGVKFVATRDPQTLGAKDASGATATPLQVIGGFDGCRSVDPADLDAMAVGETLSGCRIFLAESADGLEFISFGDLEWSTSN